MDGDDGLRPPLGDLARRLRQYRAISMAQLSVLHPELSCLLSSSPSPPAAPSGGGGGGGSGDPPPPPGVPPYSSAAPSGAGRELGPEAAAAGSVRAGEERAGDEAIAHVAASGASEAATSRGESGGGEPPGGMGVPTGRGAAEKAERGAAPLRRAAVLVPLFVGADGGFRVWLTKRAGRMSSHSGEVALPGGKRDEGDGSDAATALREAHEEIGLPPAQVTVVTHLEPFLSKHLLTVTPVIGLLPGGAAFKPVPNVSEVEFVFDAPLAMFLEDKDHEHSDTRWLGIPYRVHFFDYTYSDGAVFRVWGLTAAILIRAASLVYERAPAFGEFHPEAPDYNVVMADLARRRLLQL